MIEADAKKKQCCSNVSESCCGSACMAWRWNWATQRGAGIFSNRQDEYQKPTDHGYCGLAGKP